MYDAHIIADLLKLKEQGRDLWEIVRKYENQPFVQISAHKEIHSLTKSILQLYETLPLLVTNSNIPNGDIFSDPIYEDTTGKYPDLSA